MRRLGQSLSAPYGLLGAKVCADSPGHCCAPFGLPRLHVLFRKRGEDESRMPGTQQTEIGIVEKDAVPWSLGRRHILQLITAFAPTCIYEGNEGKR
jgi:hypothetical protein